LPVNIDNFTVVANDCRVNISWLSSDEENLSHYTLLRKTNTETYKTIAEVKAKGTSNGTQNYQLEDIVDKNQTYIYQLKPTDIDGKYTLSNEKAVRTNCANTQQIYLYPNPTDNISKLVLQNQGEIMYDIKISNSIGQVLYQTTTVVENELKEISLPVSILSTGIYNVTIYDGHATTALKLVKE
jgi:hypothetical protein